MSTVAAPRIVVNADDFGYDEDTVAATIAAFEAGLLTSATIMTNMPATDAAVAWAREHPEFSFGVHLVWVGDGVERPLSPVEQIPSLVRADGAFGASTPARLRGMLHRVPAGEIAAEAERQIVRLRDSAVPVSHVDAHGHLHKFGSFRTALRAVLPRLGIARVRSAQDVYLAPSRRSPTVWLGPYWRRRLRQAFRTTDHFYMPASDGAARWQDELLPVLLKAGGTTEIGVHPGRTEAWRAAELEDLGALVGAAAASGVELVDWRSV